ncbi:xanthine dehydrogenase accessory protein XdhC [Sulfuriferula nivalis]|uniref:Xanthine dehydrogenase accessory protein XdhC n=1 Tax=Sulfuriferula nivalis TaxID=2675298 RepID=A0A809SHM8_9PROT|nr:xanthine dehydrogenase accessory protein XdhC [Sulfuriferula nivalis]BBP00940.1 xanthine dehydrogenase accessory protein XdhC [Sulfuriferula nivalis]
MKHWLAELDQLLTDGHDVVRIVVAATKGSTPRKPGASMLVHQQGMSGTLGGGNLEFKAIALARDLLAQTGSMARYQRFSLATTLGQCCGGIVDLWWERYTIADRSAITTAHAQLLQHKTIVFASRVKQQSIQRIVFESANDHSEAGLASEVGELMDAATAGVRLLQSDATSVLLERLEHGNTPLWIFGAGHVGQAIVSHLRDLPFDLIWIDNRADIFPADVVLNKLVSNDPAAEVEQAPDHAWFLILTHDHALDYAICAALLDQEKSGFIGLIGSATKAARFSHRLRDQGYQPERITCPIGIAGISGKEPATIAISVVAQLMQLREAQSTSNHLPHMNSNNFQRTIMESV